MAGQNLERREVLRAIALAAAASQFPGFERWAFACQHEHGPAPQPTAAGPYQPRFFDAREYPIVERLAELIIPSDGSPGAREAGVAELIDFMVSSDPEIQYRFRYGVGWIDSHARWLHGRGFLELEPERQTEMLSSLAYKDRYREGEEDGRRFFDLMREYTVMGFYTSRAGLEELGYPGLKVFWDKMPGCPDPEAEDHRNHQYSS
jgi:hypothetical protein